MHLFFSAQVLYQVQIFDHELNGFKSQPGHYSTSENK